MEKEIDQFIGKISEVGNSFCVFIPKKVINFSGLKKDNIIKIWFKQQSDNL